MKKTPKSFRIEIANVVGGFAEDKDWGAAIREEAVRAVLNGGDRIIIDFTGVTLATQSFVHALISDVLRSEGEEVLTKMEFKGCEPGVKGIIETVVQYSLETMEDDSDLDADRIKTDSLTGKSKRRKSK
jgi:STAS-like domain of unknown function (DUF4325)